MQFYGSQLVEMIKPGLSGIDPKWSAAKQLKTAVEANVHWSVQEVVRSPEAQLAFKEKRSGLIVGAIYELATGKVRWLDAHRFGSTPHGVQT